MIEVEKNDQHKNKFEESIQLVQVYHHRWKVVMISIVVCRVVEKRYQISSCLLI
jgi:hypothetical protein